MESVWKTLFSKGIRGPHGGYELAREPRGVTANDILRAASTVHEAGEEPNSELVAEVVLPVLSVAEREFGCFCFGFWQSSVGTIQPLIRKEGTLLLERKK